MGVRHLLQSFLYARLFWFKVLLWVFNLHIGGHRILLDSCLVFVVETFLVALVREAISLRKWRLADLKGRMVLTGLSLDCEAATALTTVRLLPVSHCLCERQEVATALLD